MLESAQDFASESAEAVFAKLDSDGSGGISIGELMVIIKSGEFASTISEAAGSLKSDQASKAATLVRLVSRQKRLLGLPACFHAQLPVFTNHRFGRIQTCA